MRYSINAVVAVPEVRVTPAASHLSGAGEIEAARVGRAVRINQKSLTACMRRSVEDSAVAAE